MAKAYKTWKTTEADLDTYRELYDAASSAVEGAQFGLWQKGYTFQQMERMLPDIGDASIGDDTTSLNRAFENRADFQRELRYLSRIVDSQTARVPKGYAQLTEREQGTLTAGRVDEATGQVTTAFMQREESLARRRANDMALRKIREQGIEMVRVPVLDSEGKQVTDRWRHKLFTYVTATPENERRLRALQEKDPTARYTPGDEASQAFVMRHGDLVNLGEIHERRMNPKQVYESLHLERINDMKNKLYFANYGNIVENTLVEPLANEINGYIDRIQRLSYQDRMELYRTIENSDAEYAQIDLIYHDTETPNSVKLTRMFHFWREVMVPRMNEMEGLDERDRADTEDVLPVEANDPSYTHIKGGADFAEGGNDEPTVFDTFQKNAEERGYTKRGKGGKVTKRKAKGVTLSEIRDILYGIEGLRQGL